MGYSEEPEYKLFDYVCPRCGLSYTKAGSVRLHQDWQECPSCDAKEKDDTFQVLNALKRNGLDCFLEEWMSLLKDGDNEVSNKEGKPKP